MTSDNNYEKRKTKKASQIHFEFWLSQNAYIVFRQIIFFMIILTRTRPESPRLHSH